MIRTIVANRRAVIAGLPLLALTACPGQTPSGSGTAPALTVTPAQVVQTAQQIATALATALPQIAKLPAVVADAKTTGVIAKASGYVSQAQAALTALAANTPDAKTVATALSQVWGWLNAVVAAAEAIPGIPPNIETYIVSAGIGLPVLEAFVNATLGTQLKSVAATAS